MSATPDTPQDNQSSSSTSDLPTWPVFVCYRQDDGKSAARWLATRLNNLVLSFVPNGYDAAPRLDVYFDEHAPAVGDWTSVHQPALERARAFILVCSPGAMVDFGEDDWVKRELSWWLEHRSNPPLVIDSTGTGDRYVPQSVKSRWPNAQRTVVRPDQWKVLPDAVRQPEEEGALERILGGIHASEVAVRHADLERERDRSRLLEQQRNLLRSQNNRLILLLIAVTALFVATVGSAVWAYVVQRRAVAALREQLASEDLRLGIEAMGQLIVVYGYRAEDVAGWVPDRLAKRHAWFALVSAELDEIARSKGNSGRWASEVRLALPGKVSRAKGIGNPPTAGDDERLNRRIFIKQGTFLMGSENGREDESPRHKVTVSAFYIQEHEVTNKEYRRFEPSNSGDDDLPVIFITWYDAMAYSAWLGGSLPTEAQWEYTARGESGRTYPWGEEPPSCDRTVDTTCAQPIAPVKTGRDLGKTPEGVYDLAGNAGEWCQDWYALYLPEEQTDPRGRQRNEYWYLRYPTGDSFVPEFAPDFARDSRVVRGSNRAAERHSMAPDQNSAVGFRVVAAVRPGR